MPLVNGSPTPPGSLRHSLAAEKPPDTARSETASSAEEALRQLSAAFPSSGSAPVVSLKLLAKSNATNDAWSVAGTAVGALLLATELAFMVWYYVAIRHKEYTLRCLGISAARLARRVDYVTDRFCSDVPWWQLAVWLRQVTS